MSESVDNGHSYGGVYGIANNTYALWMINRGFGELVALTPAEMQRGEPAPTCPSPEHSRHAPQMVWRSHEWACYQHDEPVRLRIPPRLQEMPAFPGGLEALAAVVDKTVEVKYWTPAPGVIPARWTYFVDGQATL